MDTVPIRMWFTGFPAIIKRGLTHPNRGAPSMFQELTNDYRRQAKQQLDDVAQLASGAWRIFDQSGDQSGVVAAFKRALAGRLLGLADAYEELDR